MYSTRTSCQILMKHEFFWQTFEKYSNIKFHEMCPLGAELFHADSHKGMTKLRVAFRNSANAPKIWVWNCQINVNGWLGVMKGAMMVYTI